MQLVQLTVMVRMGIVIGTIWQLQVHFCENRGKLQGLLEQVRYLKKCLLQKITDSLCRKVV